LGKIKIFHPPKHSSPTAMVGWKGATKACLPTTFFWINNTITTLSHLVTLSYRLYSCVIFVRFILTKSDTDGCSREQSLVLTINVMNSYG